MAALSVPDPHHLPPLERLVEYEAVQLFVERASAVKTNFGLARQLAAAQFAESLALCRELSDPHGIASCLAGLAELAEAAGQRERAAQLLGATEVLLAASGRHLEDTEQDLFGYIPITSQAEFERHVATVRAALGDEAFAAAWAKGQAMPLEQVIADVLNATAPAPAHSHPQ